MRASAVLGIQSADTALAALTSVASSGHLEVLVSLAVVRAWHAGTLIGAIAAVTDTVIHESGGYCVAVLADEDGSLCTAHHEPLLCDLMDATGSAACRPSGRQRQARTKLSVGVGLKLPHREAHQMAARRAAWLVAAVRTVTVAVVDLVAGDGCIASLAALVSGWAVSAYRCAQACRKYTTTLTTCQLCASNLVGDLSAEDHTAFMHCQSCPIMACATV